MKSKPSNLLMALERRRTVADSLLESDVINGMRTGELPSPTRLGNSLYYRMRLTGTGAVWRSDGGDTFRDPEKYINSEFVAACVGIPLLLDHPEGGRIGPDDRIIGTTVSAYVCSDDATSPEIWVIARVLDGLAQETLLTEIMSTSPSVIVGDSPDGFSEGAPLILDHLAVCKVGVWDHQQAPSGIDQEILLNDSKTTNEVFGMTPEELEAKVEALVALKLEAALSAHTAKPTADSATDLNPPVVAPQAVMADETPQTHGVTDPGHSHSITLPDTEDCAPATGGEEKTVADADDTKDESTDTEVKADSEDESKEEPKAETKADSEETPEEVKADSDEDSEMNQNAQLAALQAQVETLTKALAGQSTLSDAEAADMGTARIHADAAMQSVGKSAVQPFPGEKPMAYRKRVINELKCHSTALKDADVSTIADSATLSLIEKQVFADAAAFARSGAGIPQNSLRARKHTTEAGHTVIEYDGSPRTWLQETELKAVRVGSI
ncbi:prolipoprotein diacylglyceryl transferase [Paraburkholderia tropica]|uniref:hypothetical protein n=1 Tax=Paraburkholderia tropica TaxID=92647 RepID=UPI002AB06660|nr:hypothetical protein [Paraburkholderia tropica]